MNRPYHMQMDDIIASLDGRPRLLLHSCCGPCSTAVLEQLCRHFDVTLHYCNPNIQPREEYMLRLRTQRDVADRLGVPLVAEPYDDSEFLSAVRGLEGAPEGGARCIECFRLRLERTASAAAEGGYDFFTTTLTVSPHKNAALINELGAEIAARHAVRFLPSDFKKREGYKRSIVLSREYGLYRQQYCGCLFSKAESERQ
ncbi:MAG: epoxyqueuosine reductase QueH [Firmicutes bacterium]|nr:epoxyqueuosine reductase QueH [Bacillota bacterium]